MSHLRYAIARVFLRIAFFIGTTALRLLPRNHPARIFGSGRLDETSRVIFPATRRPRFQHLPFVLAGAYAIETALDALDVLPL